MTDSIAYERVVLPTDWSDCADEAMRHAADLARRYDAEHHVVNVVDIGMATSGMDVFSSPLHRYDEGRAPTRPNPRMVDQALVDRIEAALEQDREGLEAALPDVLDDVTGQTEALVREHPEVMTAILSRMETMDIASFVSANPDTADQLQDLLWSGMGVLVEENPEVRERITETITANFAADDCRMAGHLQVDDEAKTITGGAGQLDDADVTITGPADVLVGLLTGDVDPMTGFMRGQFELDGSMGTATKLAPVLNSLADQTPD